jgi:S1-C subfamily serine protease
LRFIYLLHLKSQISNFKSGGPMSVTLKARESQFSRSRMTIIALWLSTALVTINANLSQTAAPSTLTQEIRSRAPEKNSGLRQEARVRMRRAVAAVGLILVSDGDGDQPRPSGSGVVIRPDGVIVTNWHVIKQTNSDRHYQEIYFSLATDSGASPLDSSSYRMKVVEFDRELDLALLRIVNVDQAGGKRSSLNLPFVEIGDSQAIDLLDDLVIIGFPAMGGSTATVSHGIVEGKDNIEGWIKTDTRLLHGNSGGAAVDAEGKLIGVATKVEVDLAQNDVRLGTVGFLRPSHLVAKMVNRMLLKERAGAEPPSNAIVAPVLASASSEQSSALQITPVKIKGVVRFAGNGKPIAGARVGLIIAGREVAPDAVIGWGGTNAEGFFQFGNDVPPGKYTIRAKVVGDERYAPYEAEIEIKPGMKMLVVELEPANRAKLQ